MIWNNFGRHTLCYIPATMGKESLKGMLKWPLVIAGSAVVLRIVLEQLHEPSAAANLVSLIAIYLVICPVYFAFRIASSGVERPYRQLLKSIVLYAALARCLVIPTYWLAYIRFLVSQGGVVGPNVSPTQVFVVTPLVVGIAWVLGSFIIGGSLGSIVIAIRRQKPA
jgi:hypothetical protein